MIDTSNFRLTIDFRDSNLDEEELEDFTQKLFTQMRDLEKVKLERIPVPKLPEGHKREKPEPGVLGVELNLASIKTLITFLWERLFGKTTELELEVENVSIKLKVGSRKDLSAAIQDVEKLIRSVSEINDG